jgi:hypothetical protein
VFLTADSTDFTDKVAGKATHEASTDAATWRCPAKAKKLTDRKISNRRSDFGRGIFRVIRARQSGQVMADLCHRMA